MRKKGLILLLIIFVLILLLYYFLTDKWYEKKIEYALSIGVGAKVEIDGFRLSFLKLESGWDRIQIADPNDTWKNLFETGRAKFDINGDALLYGRWIIEEMTIENLRCRTNRETDGKLPDWMQEKSDRPATFDKIAKNLAEELKKSSGIDFTQLKQKVDVNAVISTLNLQTPDKLKNLRNNIRKTSEVWQERFISIPQYKTKVQKLVQDAQSINPEKLKNIDGFISALNTIKTIHNEVDTLKTEIIQQKNYFLSDFNVLETEIKSVDNWIKDDISTTLSKAKLPELSTENIAKILFGQEFADRIKKAVNYYNIIQDYSDRLFAQEPKGQDISFPDRINLPKFWIKKISISGETGISDIDKGIVLSGAINDITSNQKIINKPTEIKLSGGTLKKQNYNLEIVLNYLGNFPEEIFQFSVSGISLNNQSLKENRLLPSTIDKGIMNVKTVLSRKNRIISGNLNIQTEQLAFQFAIMPENQINEIVQNIFKDLRKIDIDCQFRFDNERLKLRMSSNLDEVFSAKLKSVFGEEVKKGQDEIEKKVRRRLEPERQKLISFYNEKRQELESKLKDLEELINKNLLLIENQIREFEGRIESEKKKGIDKLKEKILDKLKGVIKK